jgi:hypothetical protein
MRRVIPLIAIVLGTLLLTTLTPAHATSSFGRTTTGAIPSAGLSVDYKRGSSFVLSEAGVLQQICAYLDTNGGANGGQWVRYAVYQDENGVPGQLLIWTENRYFEAFQHPADWYCLPTNARWLLEPGAYWLVIQSGDLGGVVRYYYDGAANWYGNADPWIDGPSSPFGPGGAGEGTISIRADYLPLRAAGATTVGTRVSSPMSAQMKRGSSFVLTEAAELWKLNAYVDGLGGTAGSQPLWLALYDDANGEPSSLIAKAQVDAGPAGSTAHWVSGSVGGSFSPVLLMPGRYWIVLHTGSPAGVLRYYMEGSGNWRGNANPGAEPSQFFGAASAGDGTITANISYTPQNVLHHTAGRTTPGTIPSGPLAANYVRGSRITPDHYFSEGWVTALWAYMDGNGGAGGSQKVRLALYKRTTPDYNTIGELAMSDEVTIPAGKAPGWVRFPMPYTRIYNSMYEYFGTLHIMMFSGGSPGVARYYLSNDADNWHGGPVAYGDTVPGSLDLDEERYPGSGVLLPGNGTISIYAEYVNTAATDQEQ